jgi:nucleotide-binding universal stress UspA family protein
MKKILIAYDGSPGAQLAIRDLTRAGFNEAVEAKVLTIADVWLPQPSSADTTLSQHPSFQDAHRRAEEALANARQTSEEGARLAQQRFPSWTVSNEAMAESPAWGVLAMERKWNPDLIVIGSQGRSLLERAFLGSVSSKVAAEATCSVRLVRPHVSSAPGADLKIFLGLDGSEDGKRALEEVLSRTWPARTEAHLVTIIDDKIRGSLLAEIGNDPKTGVEAAIHALLQTARGKFEARGINATVHAVPGDPKQELLKLARELDVDCIFLGARGMDHKKRLYLGTLASAVCSRAHCTVEVVR